MGVAVGWLASATAVAGLDKPTPSSGRPICAGSTPSRRVPGVMVGNGMGVGAAGRLAVGAQAESKIRTNHRVTEVTEDTQGASHFRLEAGSWSLKACLTTYNSRFIMPASIASNRGKAIANHTHSTSH